MKVLSVFVWATFVCGLSLYSFESAAQVYKWTDDNGKVHFGSRPPAKKSVQRVNTKVNSYTPESTQANNDLVIYTTSWCGFCKKAKAYFNENNIAFTEYNIEEDRIAKLEYDRINGRGVPVIMMGDKRMNGFSVERFKAFYKSADGESEGESAS